LFLTLPKTEEATEGWRKLNNAEHHKLNLSPNIIRIIKSRKMNWAGNVAHIGEERNAYRDFMGHPNRVYGGKY
jgi:hypothetical protein